MYICTITRRACPRNMPGPMLHMTEHNQDDKTEVTESDEEKGKEKPTQADTNHSGQESWDLYATSKGGKGKGNKDWQGQGIWRVLALWGMGHPRRECPVLLGQQPSHKGDVAALKGGKTKGKGKKGKGGKGSGYKGKGKGHKSGYYNDYRSPGEGVGKGLHYTSDE